MPVLRYSVVATLPDEQACEAYIEWLLAGHSRGVLDGGAITAEVVRLAPDSPPRIESSYTFATEQDFARYEQDAAPALRADGAARFGSLGVQFERRQGIVLAFVDS